MTTTLVADQLPPALAAALAEVDRRLAAADAAGRYDGLPCTVVINDAPEALTERAVLEVAKRVAKLGRRLNVSLELRGTWLVPQLVHFGGSDTLYLMAVTGTVPHVYYRCMRPLAGFPLADLNLGFTRVRHADPNVRRLGRPDDGVLVGWDPARDGAWALVLFSGDEQPTRVLAADVLVEVDPE